MMRTRMPTPLLELKVQSSELRRGYEPKLALSQERSQAHSLGFPKNAFPSHQVHPLPTQSLQVV